MAKCNNTVKHVDLRPEQLPSVKKRQHEPHLHECPKRECVGRARRAGGATWSVRTLSPAAGCVHAPGLETLHPRAVCGGSVISGCLPPQALARVSPTHAHLAVLLLPVCRCHAHGMALSHGRPSSSALPTQAHEDRGATPVGGHALMLSRGWRLRCLAEWLWAKWLARTCRHCVRGVEG